LALFLYKAVRPNGETVDGEMEAADETAVVRRLQDDGLIPIKTILASSGGGILRRSLGRGGATRKRFSDKKLTMLTRELATLLEAGMTLDRSLQILRDLSDEETAALLNRLREKVQGGSAFSAALAEQGGMFSPLYINMVKAGEAGGVMQGVLARLADYLERSGELKESVRSALIYPTILLVVAGISVMVLLMFVVPQFKEMFADMGKELPIPTQIVIALGDGFRAYWWAMLAAVLLGTAALQSHLQQPAARYRWDRRILGWPLFGDLVAKVETARFARTLATLLSNGLPLLSALTLVKDVLSNRIYMEAIGNAAESLKHGKGLSEPLVEQKLLPPLALQMIKVGEESGNLEGMLHKVADVFDREVRLTVARMLTLLEPIMIIGLGVVVAGIIISILLAVLSANELAF